VAAGRAGARRRPGACASGGAPGRGGSAGRHLAGHGYPLSWNRVGERGERESYRERVRERESF